MFEYLIFCGDECLETVNSDRRLTPEEMRELEEAATRRYECLCEVFGPPPEGQQPPL